ncbi:MAG: carbohydrate ABC transporter permease [Bacillota bacterium]
MKGSFRKYKASDLLVLLSPSLLLVGFIFAIPIVYSIYISFHKYNIFSPGTPFIGLDNYRKLFLSGTFWHSLGITFYFVVLAVAVEIVLALLIALLLNQRFYGQKLLRVMLLLPWAVPWVVNGIMWRWIYNSEFGPLNALLRQLGLISSDINWLGEPFRALNMMIMADIWKETAFIAVLFLAGLQTIPIDYYEAAEIGGANMWRKFWHITLPLLKPIMFVALSLRTIWAFKTFDLVYALTRGGPSRGTNLLNFHIYNTTFSNLNFGYGASLSIILTLIILILTLVYYRVVLGEEEK